ncbi:DUF308 domain-containing protein [Microbacterium sp. ZW T5_56]|uniref:DUF308 domain-containing protein n=1 Tax=Microbacterium sp. ZW T5_56 TaxID=3378081 RepID=UPI003854CCFC
MTTTESATTLGYSRSLRSLYFVRFAFAIIWVGVMVAVALSVAQPSIALTAFLIIYPLFDAGAVLWQLRANPDHQRSRVSEVASIGVSVAVAIAIGIASSFSLSAALAVWGAWAIVAGIPQLITAIRNRRSGGQVPQMLSGGISVFAGAAFLFQGLQGSTAIVGVAGYAAVGAIFFLVSAIRLSVKLRHDA